MNERYEYITSCPYCGFPADVDTIIVLTTNPPKYKAQCKQESCGESFTVFANEIMKKELVTHSRPVTHSLSSGNSVVVEQGIGKQALSMKPDEVMINRGNYVVKRRLPENIDSVLEKILDEIIDLYIYGRDEYETSERHTLDIFKDDVFDILERYLGGE